MTRRRCFAGALLLLAVLPLAGCRSLRDRERPPFRRVSAPVAFEIMRDSPWMLVLDLRTPQAFNGDTGHLYRALNIPLARLSFDLGKISLWRDETFEPHVQAAGKWLATKMNLATDADRYYPQRSQGYTSYWEAYFRVPALWYCEVDASGMVGELLERSRHPEIYPADRSATPALWAAYDVMGLPRESRPLDDQLLFERTGLRARA